MSISNIRSALKQGLQTIDGMHVYEKVPEKIEQFPACVISPKRGDYNQHFVNSFAINFTVTLLIGRWGDIKEAQDKLDSYLMPTGSLSIKAAIEASAAADVVHVYAFEDYGGIQFASGNQYANGSEVYLGCHFMVSIFV